MDIYVTVIIKEKDMNLRGSKEAGGCWRGWSEEREMM